MPAERGLRAISRIIDDDYMMHPMEPSFNSADWYHFSTVHSSLNQHWLASWKWGQIFQTIRPPRSVASNSCDDDGSRITGKEVLIVDEEIKGVRFLNGLIKVPDKIAQSLSKVQVRFSGPMLVRFHVRLPVVGELVVYMPVTPVAPFVTHLEFWGFAGPRFPWLLAHLITNAVRHTVNQDREVWEHRQNPTPRNAVKGDYNWQHYDKWFKEFYSDTSVKWEDADLSW